MQSGLSLPPRPRLPRRSSRDEASGGGSGDAAAATSPSAAAAAAAPAGTGAARTAAVPPASGFSTQATAPGVSSALAQLAAANDGRATHERSTTVLALLPPPAAEGRRGTAAPISAAAHSPLASVVSINEDSGGGAAGWAAPTRLLYAALDAQAQAAAEAGGRMVALRVHWVNRPTELREHAAEVLQVPRDSSVGALKRLICRASGGGLWPTRLRPMQQPATAEAEAEAGHQDSSLASPFASAAGAAAGAEGPGGRGATPSAAEDDELSLEEAGLLSGEEVAMEAEFQPVSPARLAAAQSLPLLPRRGTAAGSSGSLALGPAGSAPLQLLAAAAAADAADPAEGGCPLERSQLLLRALSLPLLPHLLLRPETEAEAAAADRGGALATVLKMELCDALGGRFGPAGLPQGSPRGLGQKERFTKEEMTALVAGIEEHGLRWTTIHRTTPLLAHKKQDKWRNWQKNVAAGWTNLRVPVPASLRARIEALVKSGGQPLNPESDGEGGVVAVRFPAATAAAGVLEAKAEPRDGAPLGVVGAAASEGAEPHDAVGPANPPAKRARRGDALSPAADTSSPTGHGQRPAATPESEVSPQEPPPPPPASQQPPQRLERAPQAPAPPPQGALQQLGAFETVQESILECMDTGGGRQLQDAALGAGSPQAEDSQKLGSPAAPPPLPSAPPPTEAEAEAEAEAEGQSAPPTQAPAAAFPSQQGTTQSEPIASTPSASSPQGSLPPPLQSDGSAEALGSSAGLIVLPAGEGPSCRLLPSPSARPADGPATSGAAGGGPSTISPAATTGPAPPGLKDRSTVDGLAYRDHGPYGSRPGPPASANSQQLQPAPCTLTASTGGDVSGDSGAFHSVPLTSGMWEEDLRQPDGGSRPPARAARTASTAGPAAAEAWAAAADYQPSRQVDVCLHALFTCFEAEKDTGQGPLMPYPASADTRGGPMPYLGSSAQDQQLGLGLPSGLRPLRLMAGPYQGLGPGQALLGPGPDPALDLRLCLLSSQHQQAAAGPGAVLAQWDAEEEDLMGPRWAPTQAPEGCRPTQALPPMGLYDEDLQLASEPDAWSPAALGQRSADAGAEGFGPQPRRWADSIEADLETVFDRAGLHAGGSPQPQQAPRWSYSGGPAAAAPAVRALGCAAGPEAPFGAAPPLRPHAGASAQQQSLYGGWEQRLAPFQQQAASPTGGAPPAAPFGHQQQLLSAGPAGASAGSLLPLRQMAPAGSTEPWNPLPYTPAQHQGGPFWPASRFAAKARPGLAPQQAQPLLADCLSECPSASWQHQHQRFD
ncbi:hypothetical protein HYH03_009906 [Edaphochlamys debaryana]|uniref:Myb-like domain-containing protein n=1 Tax=Edaphochlamys debaryana TaxID=47281 RepID=A0A836BXZ4_9CHLO|nr:hypothetical protein HYH03_009906 [Edaphochlamys debaryana]|eukprot:KAG2491743.1 hypothetical protein HYH03_009906 [Edaphochlamys debaryana]